MISVGSLDTSDSPGNIQNCIKELDCRDSCPQPSSGEAAQSDDDIRMTKRIIEAGKIVGITVLDHVIIGRGQYIS